MKRLVEKSRNGLSPLLAILIGLVVTIVAGILLAQLFFSYAATLSSRPAVNLEYIDLIENGVNDVLVIGLKNVGNVPVNVDGITVGGTTCPGITRAGSGTPGGAISITCTGAITPQAGAVVGGYLTVPFTDGSQQVIAFSARARTA